jgi:hypothetical protein
MKAAIEAMRKKEMGSYKVSSFHLTTNHKTGRKAQVKK